MPALGMAQEKGRLIAWLKREGERVSKGEAIMEIETDKATVEIEASASGILTGMSASAGDDVPVGQTIAWILAPGESLPEVSPSIEEEVPTVEAKKAASTASPVAERIAAEHGIDLTMIQPSGGRIQKDDVLAYLNNQNEQDKSAQRIAASPKARQMAQQTNIDLNNLTGSGPQGAILAADVSAAQDQSATMLPEQPSGPTPMATSSIWRSMVARVSNSWNNAPHFYLQREVNASRLIEWRNKIKLEGAKQITYTDLLVKIAASGLHRHPLINATWRDSGIVQLEDINIGIAVAIEGGLTVPVIHQTDKLGLIEIMKARLDLITRAKAKKLGLNDLSAGTFTISNLGMYGVDVFNAVLNPPQAAIMAVGRITERVVPINGEPTVQPMMVVSMSFDHRVVDGARGAQFLQTIINLIEEPLRLVS